MVYNYYKGLIAFRKAHAALRLTNAADVHANITSVDGLDENVLAFRINGGVNGGNVRRHFCDLQSKQYRDICHTARWCMGCMCQR